jgi:hypothetical protein
MGTILEPDPRHIYYYDLEFASPRDLAHGVCGKEQIWEIAAFHPASGRKFTRLVHTDELEFGHKPPQGDKVHIKRALGDFIRFVGPHAVLISHGNFKADKPILENTSKKLDTTLPNTWLFFDSLLFLRTCVRAKKYTLEHLCKKPTLHRAMDDCLDLAHLLSGFSLAGPLYPPYVTSLQRCRWLGPASEKALMQRGINSLENLVCYIHDNKRAAAMALIMLGLPPITAHPIARELETKWIPKRRNIQL